MKGRANRLISSAVVLVGVFIWRVWGPDGAATRQSAPVERTSGTEVVAEAFAAERSDVPVTVSGTVQRTLADDNEGSRHQRFILTLADGHTLLVAHNIDLAERVPLAAGDPVTVSGEYEWSAQGGVVHWTHHDPGGRRTGGWIEHAGRRYR